MPKRSRKKPRDLNLLVAQIVSEATEGRPEEEPKIEGNEKNPHAVALGHLGGKKGGPARAKKLTKKRRSEIARKAAKIRWSIRP